MDDDVPLAQLLNKKPSKLDDDTPLANLAKGGAALKRKDSKGGAAAKAGAAGAAKAKGRPAAAPKAKDSSGAPGGTKRKRDGSSSSSSSSSSSDSDSSSEDAKKKGGKGRSKGKGSKGQKMKLLKKKSAKAEGDGGEKEEEVSDQEEHNIKINRNRSKKESAVAEFLCRWWYVLDDWPPNDPEMYEKKLSEKGYRKVALDVWEWVPEVDKDGRKKVYELAAFRGVFRDSAGGLIDVRPQETCPCQANMMKKELPVLQELLVKAYENQIKDLDNSKYNETVLRQSLNAQLTKHRNLLAQYKEMGTR
eukprot:gnl/TRDRNA2_/TRDRNA2_180906_c0_seq1.p1 gnl/TRDRNA2_/TRDRNA2_180906_c0~~gnl/TRDRNA2_/TRDRNA2_180906_c0_seq1.p1  ORF type:complete len:326 (+),score=81.99 gnl/TRDRNA2_/TRDRNA2_180906_c0_seq1:65-979(+)